MTGVGEKPRTVSILEAGKIYFKGFEPLCNWFQVRLVSLKKAFRKKLQFNQKHDIAKLFALAQCCLCIASIDQVGKYFS